MITYRCDGCGRELPKHNLRYVVTMDVRAAYEETEISLMDLVSDHRAEMLTLIERLKRKNPKDIEETVYKGLRLDLCPPCQRAFIRDPIHFHPEQGSASDDIDIDSFLRTLGYGGKESEDEPGLPETP